MLEIEGLRFLTAGRYPKRGVQRNFTAKCRPLSLAVLIFAMIFISSAQLEYEPGEREAERLFELGLGGPWIISERHPEMYPRDENETRPPTPEFSWYSQYFSMTSFGGMVVERYFLSGVPDIYGAGPGGQPAIGPAHPPGHAGAVGLWIMGDGSWTEFAIVPQNAYLRLLALHASGGAADLYQIKPSNRAVERRYTLYPGYSLIAFHPEEVGRHILLFSVDGGATSNVVVVDVKPGTWPTTPPDTGPWPAPGTETGPGTGSQPGYGPGYGSSQVTLRSASLRGYSVYVDGSYVGADGQAGDVRDGILTITVSGGTSHAITVQGSGRTCRCEYFYESGRSYNIDLCD